MSAGNDLPTDTEVLFFALQIVQRTETAAEAKVWAQEVLRFSGGSTEADVWPPPGAAEWQGKGSKPAPLYARMDKAYKSVWCMGTRRPPTRRVGYVCTDTYVGRLQDAYIRARQDTYVGRLRKTPTKEAERS